MSAARRILWRRLDLPGHDACCIREDASGWQMDGMAVFGPPYTPSALTYAVELDARWVTRSARVTGWSGQRNIDITLHHDGTGGWRVNGAIAPQVRGALDVDLGFTPATNTNAIRRLALAPGAAQDTTAAWLDAQDWTLKPLVQRYHRIDTDTYHYASLGHGFSTTLVSDDFGLIIDYPQVWTALG